MRALSVPGRRAWSEDSGATNMEVLVRGQQKLTLKRASLSWREVDGEVIVLDKRSWTYMGINGSGATLWKALEQDATPSELEACLRTEFELDEDIARRDVETFLKMLESHDLLETVG